MGRAPDDQSYGSVACFAFNGIGYAAMTCVHQADSIASTMLKSILSTVARVFSVLLAGSALINLIQAGPDLRGPTPVVVARVMAILVSAALAWLLWRAGSKRVASTEPVNGSDVGR
jgi:hypothetical protein